MGRACVPKQACLSPVARFFLGQLRRLVPPRVRQAQPLARLLEPLQGPGDAGPQGVSKVPKLSAASRAAVATYRFPLAMSLPTGVYRLDVVQLEFVQNASRRVITTTNAFHVEECARAVPESDAAIAGSAEISEAGSPSKKHAHLRAERGRYCRRRQCASYSRRAAE